MTALAKKPLLKIGSADDVFHAPQRTFDASDLARAQRWVAKFKEMKAEGFQFPMPWGHRQRAMPRPADLTEEQWQAACEDREHDETRWNGSYIEDCAIEHTPKGTFLTVSFEPPPGYKQLANGDLVNERDGTKVRELSGAWGDYRDGKNRLHKDILIHAALCTKPVWHGQTMSLAQPCKPTMLSLGSVTYAFTASLASGMTTMAMPMTEKPKKKDKLDKPPEGDEDVYEPMDLDDEDMDEEEAPEDIEEPIAAETDLEETPPPEIAPPDVPAPVTPGVDAMGECKELLRVLGEMGVALPPKCDDKNIVHTLLVALTALQAAGMRFQPNEPDEAQPAPASVTSGQAAPQPEQGPMPTMMSLGQMNARDLANLQRQNDHARREISKTCKRLKKLGLPVWWVDRQKAALSTTTLSMRTDGKMMIPMKLFGLRKVLEAMQARAQGDAPPKTGERVNGKTTLSTRTYAPVIAEPSPTDRALAAKEAKTGLPPDHIWKHMLATAAAEARSGSRESSAN